MEKWHIYYVTVISSNIFPLKRITRSRYSCLYNNYIFLFKKKEKQKDTFSNVTSYQMCLTSLNDSLHILHGTIFRNSMGEGIK